MDSEHRLAKHCRLCAYAAGAFLVHLGVVFAIPAEAAQPARTVEATVWLEAAPSAHEAGMKPTEGAAGGPVAKATKPALARPQRHKISAPPPALNAPAEHEGLEADAPALTPSAAEQPATSASEGPAHAAQGPGSGGNSAGEGGAGKGDAEGASGGGAVKGPGLLALGSPCAGYFPSAANAPEGEVQITVEVGPDGRAARSSVLMERPRGQGFGSAAMACARRLRFAPAVGRSGAPVPGQAKIKLRFHRS